MSENAKTKIEHAKEVLSECQLHADEEWMVRHLAIVMAHITEAGEIIAGYRQAVIDHAAGLEQQQRPTMLECWLVHPVDDNDCLNCPSVKDCREVRKKVVRQKEAIEFIKGKISKWPSMLGYVEEMDRILSKPGFDMLLCKCGWTGTVDDQDALGTECGCCPRCGNEDLEFQSDVVAGKDGE